jgi:hypothetical protein
MSTKISVQNDLGRTYYEASFNPDENWVLSDWSGFVTVEEVKKAANTGLEVFLKMQGNCKKMLNSNEKLQGSWDDANEWIANEWMPRALEGGLKYFAHVVSPDIFAQMSAESMEQNFKEAGFTMRTFGSLNDAENWLRSMN